MEETALVRPQPGHWGIWIALAVLIVVVFGGGAGYYFLVPHTGRMVINVTDTEKAAAVAHVEVYVDGSKRCETTPCILDKIEPGSHSVRVFAQGYDQAPDQFVSIEARKEAHADFTVSMTSSAKGTGIKVAGTQAGLRLRVDGRDIGPLPQELHDLQPGNHSVEVVGTERYQSFEKNIIVAENETVDLGTVTLKVIKGKATINLATSGAKVYLVSGSDRRELPSFPISVDITDMSKTWSLEAQKPGYLDYRQPISFDDGQAEKLYNVELTLKGTVPTATNTVVSLPPPTPAPPTPPAPPPTTQQPPAAGDAWITINSIPPSTCYLDGRALGMTPKPKVHVSPGRHSVKFVNSDLGVTKDVGVTVGAGETKFAVVNLNN